MKQLRAALIAPLMVLAGLFAPAVAQAHHVDTAESWAKCEYVGGKSVLTFGIKFKGFNASYMPINGHVWLDDKKVKTYVDYRFDGSNHLLVYTQDVTPGPHKVKGVFTWRNQGSLNGTVEKTVSCGEPRLEIEKDGPATAYVGDQVTFTYKVENTGDVTIGNPVVTDDKCAPVVKMTKNQNVFDVGDVWEYACTTTITDAMGDALVNTATACADLKVCDTDTHTTDIPKPAIALVKTGAETAAAGSTYTYAFAATNTGNVRLENVELTDAKCQATLVRADAAPADATFDPGDTWNYTCTVTAPAGPAQVDNVATVCGDAMPPAVAAKTVCAEDPHTFTVPAPPADTPPADTPPADTPPVQTPPGDASPSATPPAGGVLTERIVSGRAALRGPSGCVRQAFTARVNGRAIASVAFYVDGRLVERFTSARSSYSIRVQPSKYGFGRHRVVARVTFAAESGTQARRLPLTFRRCAQGAVAPRFTG